MKKIYRLTVHGDSDIKVNGEVFEVEAFLFRDLSVLTMIDILDDFELAHIEPAFSRPPSDVKEFRAAIRQMKGYLSSCPSKTPDSIDMEFGGNRYVRLKSDYIPEDNDFED